MGPGVFEIALPFRGDAFRVVYAVQIADAIWVIHAFQKKATQGIKTPQREVDLVRYRLTRLKEIAAADFSRIRNANLGRFTVDRLMSIINRLGSRIEVRVRVRRVRTTAHAASA